MKNILFTNTRHRYRIFISYILYEVSAGTVPYPSQPESSSSSSFILIQAARPIETADKDNDIEAHTNIKTQRDRQRGTVQ